MQPHSTILDFLERLLYFFESFSRSKLDDLVDNFLDHELIGAENRVDTFVVAPVQLRVMIRLQKVAVLAYTNAELEIVLVLGIVQPVLDRQLFPTGVLYNLVITAVSESV